MRYYSEGCATNPPPCCQVNCLYMLCRYADNHGHCNLCLPVYTFPPSNFCSKNAPNVMLGHLGTKWGKNYRSQIFFVSFWISFVAWVLISLAVCSMSTKPAVVTALPFFQGTISLTNTSTNIVSELNFFAGLNIMVVEHCSDQVGAAMCPAHSQAWSSVECEQYFDNCDQCRDSSTGSATTVLIALVTQFLQIGADVQRSTGTTTSLANYVSCCSITNLHTPSFMLVP